MVRNRYTAMKGKLPQRRYTPSIKGCEPTASEAQDTLRGPGRRTLQPRNYLSETSDGSKSASLTGKPSKMNVSSGINKQTNRARGSRHVTERLMHGIQLSLQRQPDHFSSIWSTSATGPEDGEINDDSDDGDDNDDDDDDSEQPDEDMVFPRLTQDQSDDPLVNLDLAVDDHLFSREPHVQSSSNRLQAALNVDTESLWQDGSIHTPQATGSMRVEQEPGSFGGPSMAWYPTASSSLQQRLQQATYTRGCKRLCARSISFKALKSTDPGRIGTSNERESKTIMTIDDRWGSITVYKTDIVHRLGLVRSWTWVKITKPVFVVDDSSGPKIGPLSWVVFAIPTGRVEKLEEIGVALPPRPYDNLYEFLQSEQMRLRLVLRYSNAGVPSFACSEKQAHLVYPSCGHEFLTAGTLPRYDSNSLDTDRPVRSEFEKRSCEDKLRWQEVQAAMAKYACIVEIESLPGSDWESIAPGGATSLGRGDIAYPRNPLQEGDDSIGGVNGNWTETAPTSTGLKNSESIDEESNFEVQRRQERGNHIDRGSQSPKAGDYDVAPAEHGRLGAGTSADDSRYPRTPIGQIGPILSSP